MRMVVIFLGNTLEENKGLSLMKVPQWCDFKRLMDAATQMLGCDQKSPNLSSRLGFGIEMNVKTLRHSQQQPQGPKAHKKKSTIRLTYRTVFCVLQRSPLYRFLVLDEVKCKTHNQQQNSVEKSPVSC